MTAAKTAAKSIDKFLKSGGAGMQVHELSSACTIKKYACVKRIATYSRKYSHVFVWYKVTVYSNRVNLENCPPSPPPYII